jgi:signal transduction histidine kinase
MSVDNVTALEAALRRISELEAEVARLTGAAQRATCAKDDFLATLSHELRTPLNAMLGWIQLLRLHIHEPAERAHALDVLERNVRTQAQIVADLLDVSRIITGNMRVGRRRVNLERIIRRGTEPAVTAARSKDVKLSIDIEPVNGIVYGDAARLQQIVWNLVSNGVKFTPAGGRVDVRLRTDQAHAEISVSDTGMGIAPDVLPFVFERFRQADSSLTRAFGGLGLGLAIVRHLVELHGGTVHASSDGPGRGSTFSVRLPIGIAENDELACKLLANSACGDDR